MAARQAHVAQAHVGVPPDRAVARCAGRCTCGGGCHDDEELLPDELTRAQSALRAAVLSRRTSGAGAAVGVLQRSVCDAPPASKYVRGDGQHQTVGAVEYSQLLGQVGDKAWLLTNFDVDKPWLKEAHIQFIRDTIVPALADLIQHQGAFVAVVGEASRTASQEHNLELSKNRSNCVLEVLNRELIAAGVDTGGVLFKEQHVGKSLAEARRNPTEPLEQDDDRRVAILPVDHKPEDQDCSEQDRTRLSEHFLVKTACHGPDSIAINIGDIGVAGRPTFRRFVWNRVPFELDGCELRVKDQKLVGSKVTVPIQLATKNPDDPWAPCPLIGEAWLDPKTGKLVLGDGKFEMLVDRDWDQPCMKAHRPLSGLLVPAGPVECGEVPMPERADSCDKQTPPEPCSDEERQTGAKKFGAVILRVSAELPLEKIKEWLEEHLPALARSLIEKLTAAAGAAIVLIGTRDETGPKLMRTFLFLGLEVFGGEGVKAGAGVAKEATSKEPLRLATGAPGDYTSSSDLDSDIWNLPPEPAKMTVEAGSNITELLVGHDLSFSFRDVSGDLKDLKHNPFCHKDDDTTRGWFGAVSPVMCKDIGPLLIDVPKADCKKDKEEDCPPEQQLAGHDKFTFKYARASTRSLPPVIRAQAEKKAGCEVVAARINIGTEGKDAIYREYLLIGKLADNGDQLPCRYDVAKGSSTEKYLADRHLDLDPDDSPLVSSDFEGQADLSAAGQVKVKVPTPRPDWYSFTLSGKFDPTCTGPKSARGTVFALDDVKCGEAPDPKHDDTPEPLDRCQDYVQGDIVQEELKKARDGDYDEFFALARRGELVYHAALQELALWPGHALRPAVFVGLTDHGEKVVTLMDVQVLSYAVVNGQAWVVIEVLSDPCTYDLQGRPRFVHRVLCAETVAYKGMVTPLRPRGLDKPAAPAPPPAHHPRPSGTGAGSRADPLPDDE